MLAHCLQASIGFLVTTLFDLSYGVFFTVLPMLLLGLVPVINGHVARQLIGASVMCGIEVGLVAQLMSEMASDTHDDGRIFVVSVSLCFYGTRHCVSIWCQWRVDAKHHVALCELSKY